MLKHINIKVYGKVQGVFYRVTAKEKAEQLRITGFAQNMPDGSVYIEAEGNEDSLDKFIEWCHDGPEAALVDRVEVTEGPLNNFSDFNRDFVDY